jgi:hypothetical protein
MVTQSQWNSLPDVEEQTQLDEPIKVRWSSQNRSRMRRRFRAALADGYMEEAIGLPVVTRQSTNIVIKTEEELEVLRKCSSMVKWRVWERIEAEIKDQLPDELKAQPIPTKYEPPLKDHPCYKSVSLDLKVGDRIETLKYNGHGTVYDDDNNNIGDKKCNANGTITYYTVRRVEDDRVLAQWCNRDTLNWLPREQIVGVSVYEKAKAEYKEYKRQRAAAKKEAKVSKRKETDMDTLMEEVVIPHARKWANEVWPGGTVDVDEICWFWNPYLSNAAGYAYWGGAVPKTMASGRLAIGLAPGYYYQHGIDKLLEIVRHELIHIWQYEHPEGDGGHGPTFHQWTDDMDTHRHCKHWSK